MPEEAKSPAVNAAQEAEARVAQCLAEKRSFLLEAGAGAGQTYSLVKALKDLLTDHRTQLRKKNQQIACITYTNAATEVISRRIDEDKLVAVSTIHAFCWSVIRPFQPALRRELEGMEAWTKYLAERAESIGGKVVEYELGYRKVSENAVSLDHDDVLLLASKLLPMPKFQTILANRFPYIFVDEYQDTSRGMMSALLTNLVGRAGGPLIGLFGDHWQRIYDDTCGHVAAEGLEEIGKKANFRSAVAAVNVLNAMRPELPQAVSDPDWLGSANVFHTNSRRGTRRSGKGGGHWTGDLPNEEARECLTRCKDFLATAGWDFASGAAKVLLLTHSGLAAEQGYAELAKVFDYEESYIESTDDHIAFLTGKLEPAVEAFEQKRFGQMFEILGTDTPRFRSYGEKAQWTHALTALQTLRETGTIGQVMDGLEGHTCSM